MSRSIEELRKEIAELEAELSTTGASDSRWCLGDPYESLIAMRAELARLEREEANERALSCL